MSAITPPASPRSALRFIGLDECGPAEAFWRRLVVEVCGFAQARDIATRDLIVLLPFAQHVSLARAAWAGNAEAGWMPRFETTQTLALAAGPGLPARPGALSFDATSDALQCTALLRDHLPAAALRDRQRIAHLVGQVVACAQALARVRLALPPQARSGWLARARAELTPAGGPGAQERALARLALEWADTADTAAADALHALAPAGWAVLQVGAVDPLVHAVLSHAEVPNLQLDADLPLLAVCAPAATASLAVAPCADFEDEAQRAAAQVLIHMQRGETPVALIALDRVLLRRVRALLERQGVPLSDETGWRLSTTRAGASVVGLLVAAQHRAATDDVLDWLASTSGPGAALSSLESHWRRYRVTAVAQVDPQGLPLDAQPLWQRWLSIIEPLQTRDAPRRAALGHWLAGLRESLGRAGLWESLVADAAGLQVLDALHVRTPPAPGSAWARHLEDTTFDAAAFRAWVQGVLEAASFEPPAPLAAGPALVVITPLARAMLRPFAAIVCPGADAARLGAPPAPQPLLGDALARSLGLPDAAQRQGDERRAFAQLLRSPRLTLLYRRIDGVEPLQPSPWLLQLQWLREQAGQPLAEAADPRTEQVVVVRPVPRPQPRAPGLLPETLTATVCEALRACPYRFFALHVLRLADAEELDDALDKRDYGNWLHAVLQHFHTQRDAAQPGADEALLRDIAREQQAALARDDEDFLPYAASFDQLRPRYLQWLHAEEAQGLRVLETELPLSAEPGAASEGVPGLRGRLDRLDARLGDGAAEAWRILDYKTTSVAGLKERLRDPLEDTQLAFYAALLAAARGEPPGGIEAAYLALDGREGVQLLVHPQVQGSAQALVEGLAHDFRRLKTSAAMPALGEGHACEHCPARGLCRRDHWAEVQT